MSGGTVPENSTPAANQPEQVDQERDRSAVNREKGREMDPPRTVQEQVDQLEKGTDGHRRRDPLGGAAEQSREE